MSNWLIVKASQQFAGEKLLRVASGLVRGGQWQSRLSGGLQEMVIVLGLTPHHGESEELHPSPST